MKNKYTNLFLKNNYIYRIIRVFIYEFINIRKNVALTKLKLLWRDKNRHNFTTVGNTKEDNNFPIEKVRVGKYSYGSLKVISYGSDDECLSIGNFCSIANGVKFILGGEHNLKTFSTYPFKRIMIDNKYNETFSKGSIVLEDDVWVGTDTIILSGIKLGKGTVVAAGSVVIKSTEPYSIIGGNPAKLIRKRFDEEIIERLLTINFDLFSEEFVRKNINTIETNIDEKWFKYFTKD